MRVTLLDMAVEHRLDDSLIARQCEAFAPDSTLNTLLIEVQRVALNGLDHLDASAGRHGMELCRRIRCTVAGNRQEWFGPSPKKLREVG
jgi:hypothetical protein